MRRDGRGHHPELRGHRVRQGRRPGRRRGDQPRRINAGKVGLAAAGSSSLLADLAGFRLPIQSHPLPGAGPELFEPVHPTVVMSNHVHVYVSQAHKGELVMGAGVDTYNGYGQRGSFHVIEEQMAAAVELFPIFARAHVLRTWGGIVDVTLDASPIISTTPIEDLFVNCGWGTGGFKATPAADMTFAHTIANGAPHPLNAGVHARALRDRSSHRRARRRRRRPLRKDHPCCSSTAPTADLATKSSTPTAARPMWPGRRTPTRWTTASGPSTSSTVTTPAATMPSAGTTPAAAGSGSTPSATPPPTSSAPPTPWARHVPAPDRVRPRQPHPPPILHARRSPAALHPPVWFPPRRPGHRHRP